MLPKRIVAIGDSGCEGRVDPEGGGRVGRLRSWREGQDQHNYAYNLGISGDTSTGILKRLALEARPRQPDLIIIHSGLNDASRDGNPQNPPQTPLSQFQKNFRQIIKQARFLADVLVISLHPIDESKTTPVSWINIYYLLADARQYAQATEEICAEMGVAYLDIFNQWLEEDYTKKYLSKDGLHANAAGHQYVFEAVRNHLLKRYQ